MYYVVLTKDKVQIRQLRTSKAYRDAHPFPATLQDAVKAVGKGPVILQLFRQEIDARGRMTWTNHGSTERYQYTLEEEQTLLGPSAFIIVAFGNNDLRRKGEL